MGTPFCSHRVLREREFLSWVFKLYPQQKCPEAQSSWAHGSIMAPESETRQEERQLESKTQPQSCFPFLLPVVTRWTPESTFPLGDRSLTRGIHLRLSGFSLFVDLILLNEHSAEMSWCNVILPQPLAGWGWGDKGKKQKSHKYLHDYPHGQRLPKRPTDTRCYGANLLSSFLQPSPISPRRLKW